MGGKSGSMGVGSRKFDDENFRGLILITVIWLKYDGNKLKLGWRVGRLSGLQVMN
ncbi:hypothetical protein [Marivirga sp.]|uniref:hypothetical protein n=1 Tax=Marivirga sp. TaxID=2018662 RepID=UPI003DA72785